MKKTLKPGQLFTYDNHVYQVKKACKFLFTCLECDYIKKIEQCINICNNRIINFTIPTDCYIKLIK